jgi:hypothetical protein
MPQEEPAVRRRTVLRGVGAGVVPLSVRRSAADPLGNAVDEAVKSAPSVFGEVGRRINEVRRPLAGVPSVREPGETLRVELDADAEDVSAKLVPSFGAATPETDLSLESIERDLESETWDDEFLVARFTVPELGRQFTEGLYDLVVAFDGSVDGQPRAVSVHDQFPDEPTVAIMGDPHVGDPRPFRDGMRKSFEERNPDPFLFRYEETFGTGTEADRWSAFQRANAEVNADDPDLVLVIGDLAFGSANYFQEYEDAYRIFNQINAPTFVTIGNHDGYITPGVVVDGKKLWRRYFAPWHYSVDIRPELHFVSIDSYDWPALDRVAPSAVPSTWGGQVRDDQLVWLQEDLRTWSRENEGTILTLSHHNPSWEPTEGGEVTRTTDGTSGAEQAGRGVEQSGGGWVGENRLAVRRLLEEVGVSLHVSGHAHRDRVARYVDYDSLGDDGEASIIATTGTGLEHVDTDGTAIDSDDDYRADTLATGDGVLFVEATTAASGTTQYWGWRTVPLDLDTGTVDPREFGYPATDAFLEDRALQPDLWSDRNADLGLYSTPSYLFDSEILEAARERVVIRIHNDLARSFAGAVTLPLGECRGVHVQNGEMQWRRVGDEWQDVRVAFDVPAGETLDVSARCVSKAPR